MEIAIQATILAIRPNILKEGKNPMKKRSKTKDILPIYQSQTTTPTNKIKT